MGSPSERGPPSTSWSHANVPVPKFLALAHTHHVGCTGGFLYFPDRAEETSAGLANIQHCPDTRCRGGDVCILFGNGHTSMDQYVWFNLEANNCIDHPADTTWQVVMPDVKCICGVSTRYFIITAIALVLPSCSPERTSETINHTLYIGTLPIDDPDQLSIGLAPKQSIYHEVGAMYGYSLYIPGLKGRHEIREELILPGPGDWNATIRSNDSIRISEDNMRVTHEYSIESQGAIDCGSMYHISAGDPKGVYKFRISLNGEFLNEGSITIK